MKSFILVLAALTSIGFASYEASGKAFAVYGEDHRQDFYEITDPAMIKLADSTLAVFSDDLLSPRNDVFEFDTTPMSDSMGICPNERFSQQPVAAFCSAILISENLVLTAGHCVHNKTCESTYFAFGYALHDKNQKLVSLPASEVYSCSRIIARSNTDSLDFAVVELDRAVPNHLPIPIAKENVEVGRSVFVYGHPAGLPLKYSGTSPVTKSTRNNFTADLDVLGGNSGSGVFTEDTHELVGVLVRGDDDYLQNQENQCRMVHVCGPGECDGEESTHGSIIRATLHSLRTPGFSQ
jgi:V8-like Glu-specific endopeptidase